MTCTTLARPTAIATITLLASTASIIASLATPSASHAQNITVYADHELEWRRDTRQYFARGNATVITPDLILRADTITANTTSTGDTGDTGDSENATRAVAEAANLSIGSGSITSISGTGRARIDYRNASGRAPHIVYLRTTDSLWLAGGEITISRGRETIRAQNTITYARSQGSITAQGDVRVTLADGRQLAGERVDAYLTQDRQAISHITMAGDVTLFDGVNVLTGALATINLATGTAQLQTDGKTRVRGQFQP